MHQEDEAFKFCLETRNHGALPLDLACLECSLTDHSTLIMLSVKMLKFSPQKYQMIWKEKYILFLNNEE
jgi:hypothetical protein